MEVTGTSKAYVKGSLRSIFAHVSGVSEVHVDGSSGAPVLHQVLSAQAHTHALTLSGRLPSVQNCMNVQPRPAHKFGNCLEGM